ncbi:MAG: PBP1A family penicillin-binding protein [Candidatus Buchananbacteria bacterium]|nr:PBP1A family penicillin-binding protein [Candidatus Buchananbacteria bacterium]
MPNERLTPSQDWRHPNYVPQTPRQRPSLRRRRDGYAVNKRQLLTSILTLGSIGLGVFVVTVFIGLAWVSRDLPNPQGVIDRSLTVSTKIYDRTGQTVLYDIHGDIKRSLINLDQIPDYAQKATLAAEDRNFYTHRGISITGMLRSVIKNVTTGSKVGGSTLTQQFVKNAILTNEKTYTRKVKEILLSYQIERKFSKDEILQMYFNEIPYGSVIYGIEAASQSYFGKSSKDLTLGEAAILAAIPQAPTFYSPYGSNKDRLLVRQRYILDSMADLGYVTKDQAEAAKQEKITFKPLQESITAPHFVMYIRELLSEQYGEDFITQEGLKVYTSLDLDKQKLAEEAVKVGVETNGPKYGFANASLVAIDPKTGQILAMVGSADYFNDDIDGQVNVAVRPRQPGSSFKPIVYTAAFAKGYTPNTIVYDVNTNFDTTGSQPYEPKNYNLAENGPVSLRKALAGSLNIPAVKITYLTGINTVLDLAEKLGYTTFGDRNRFGLAIVLGGGEVKLLEHTSAYGALAQEGTHHQIAPILKIEDKRGEVLFEYKDKADQVLDPEIARQTTDVLSDDGARAFIFGARGKLTLPDRPVAAKTGTTNDYHDAWTMGYTPSLVTGVWVGNSDNKEMKRGADGSIIAAPIWNQFMRTALSGTPAEQFTKPQPVTTGKAVLDGQVGGEKIVKIDTVSGKLATQYTPPETTREIITRDYKTILYYIDKDDPRGPTPTNPQNDPQYYNWQSAIDRWAAARGMATGTSSEVIPTEYDDAHRPEDQPQVSIISPSANQTISDSQLKVQINASAPRSISTIEYYIGSELLRNTNNQTVTLPLDEVANGSQTLRVVVKDEFGNRAENTVTITINNPNTVTPQLSWTQPGKNTTISNFPTELRAQLSNGSSIKKIDVYFRQQGSGTEQYLGNSDNPNSNPRFTWNQNPGPGTYQIYAYLFTNTGKRYQSETLTVIIK